MLVMPVATVLALQKLMPHQEMLRKKLLLPYNQKTMAGRVIFVSHQVRPRSRRFSRSPRRQTPPTFPFRIPSAGLRLRLSIPAVL